MTTEKQIIGCMLRFGVSLEPTFEPGTRVRIEDLGDISCYVRDGDTGTVVFEDLGERVWVEWDNPKLRGFMDRGMWCCSAKRLRAIDVEEAA